MIQSRTPRGVPTGGEFIGNAHDEAPPIPEDGFDDRGRKIVPKEEVKVGDIVWDRDEGFVVAHIDRNFIGRMEQWSRGKDAESTVQYRSEDGHFWSPSPRQESVVVLRDQDALRDHYDDLDEY